MKSKRLIYSLCCPFTKQVHYIGKSTQGMLRPMQHLNKSHSEKVNEWVNNIKQIGYIPIVNILEYVPLEEDLDNRERYWIQKELNKDSLLLNSFLVTPLLISNDLDKILGNGEGMEHLRIAKFVKEKRKQIKLDQKLFAEKAGVALTVLRKIEQGKTNLNFESILQVLKMFGCTLDISRLRN
jgi:DNA-binding XRE family transcriptional regulator